MNYNDDRGNNSVPLDADDAQNLTMPELVAALDLVCDEYESVRNDLLARMRDNARQDRIGGDRQ